MMNYLVCVGRLVNEVEEIAREHGNKGATITLAVPRSLKNAEGEYETDFIPCVLWGSIASNTKEYVHKGDLIGIKGRLESNEGQLQVVVDKVTFLSSNSEKINDEIK